MIFDNVNINKVVNAIILVLFLALAVVNISRRNEINGLERQLLSTRHEQTNCEQLMMIYDTRIENLSNIINVKDIQIDNITKMNVTLTEQVRQMKRDYDHLMDHYVTTHDSLLRINKKYIK